MEHIQQDSLFFLALVYKKKKRKSIQTTLLQLAMRSAPFTISDFYLLYNCKTNLQSKETQFELQLVHNVNYVPFSKNRLAKR